jgi:hypothetical protein
MASERNPTAQEPPRCTACGQIMRLVTVQPAFFYGDLDEHAYSCECGGAATAFVRRRQRVI